MARRRQPRQHPPRRARRLQPLLDQLAQTDQIIRRIALFKEECEKAGRAYHPGMVATARALQMIHGESERADAYATRKRVLSVIGDLARDKLADRVEDDTAPCSARPRRSSRG